MLPDDKPSVRPGEAQPTQLAKAALRRLAEQRLEPTPDNYRQAYAHEYSKANHSPLPPPASLSEPTINIEEQADAGERWANLISRLMRGAERGGRQWTSARKKDSLMRVLEGSKNSAQRLRQRLTQLVSSWESDTLDSSLVDSLPDNHEHMAFEDSTTAELAPLALPATEAHRAWPPLATHAVQALGETLGALLESAPIAANEASQALRQALDQASRTGIDTGTAQTQAIQQAQEAVTRACEQASRVIEHRHQIIGQLTKLCGELTDSLVDLAEDESWVQGQCAAMRHQIQDGLQQRGLQRMQELLAETRSRQRSLKQEREAARLSLKHLIHQMLSEMAELGQTTDRFQSKLGNYADTITQADTLESLAGMVREMVTDSRAVQSVVAQTQQRLQAEHSRASALTERVQQLESEIQQLSNEVSTDPLTQIANRRGLQRAFEAEQARVARTGSPLAIGLLDVDNFKRLNDKMGHQTGDEALKFLARRVGECLRPVDVVARYGGEEFVVLMPDTASDNAQLTLTRLQRALSSEFFTHEDKKVFITFSAGVTPYRLGETMEAALERADLALYEAKHAGKNRTCIG